MLASMLSVCASAAVGVPVISSVSINESRNVITIQFAGEIAEAKGVTLKSKMQLSRDGSEPALLPIGTQVTVRSSSILVTLPSSLTAKQNYIVIPRGTLQNQGGNLTTSNINARGPAIASINGATIDSTNKIITLKFEESVSGYPSDSSLKNGYISLARDGKNYDEIINSDQITMSGNQIKITLDKEIAGTTARIKIHTGKLQNNSTGNINLEDIISPAINIVSADAPVFESAEINSDGTKITFYFDRDIKRSSGVTAPLLKSSVSVSRNGGSYGGLSTYDRVEIDGSKLVVTLYIALYGANNRVRIASGVVASQQTGKALPQMIDSPTFNLGDSGDGGPQYKGIAYDKDAGTVRIYFDRDIRAVTTYKLLGSIYYSVDGSSYELLERYKNIEIYENNSILITLKEYLSGTTRFRVQSGTIEDMNGIDLSGNVYTDYVSENGTPYYGGDEDEKDTSDNTGSDTAPDNIQSSTQPTQPPADTGSGSVSETVPVITPSAGTAITEVTAAINGTVVDITENTEVTDGAGNTTHTVRVDSAKAKVELSSRSDGVVLSVAMPTDAYGGTFSIPGDVMKILSDKGGTVTVECAGACHYIPLSLMSIEDIKKELGVSDSALDNISVEFTVSRASSVYVSDLSSAAAKSGFTALIAPTEFTIQYKSASATRAITKFDEYVEKSFNLSPAQQSISGITVVRVETSGAVNHVPSKINTRQNGDVCLTARTRQNGVYAVISATRTYSDTPAWAAPAVNSLGARQVLGDFAGSSLKPSQAATRAEVAGIVTKGMGIYTDKSGASKFLDVTLTDPYYASTAVAVEYGLINGYGDNTFKPEQNISRQEAAAILARTLRLAKNQQVSESATLTAAQADALLSKFADASSVADWAKMEIAECVNAGIINGDNNGKLNPTSNVTRAELIQMVYNLLTKYSYIGK